jgi:hypothetical protein
VEKSLETVENSPAKEKFKKVNYTEINFLSMNWARVWLITHVLASTCFMYWLLK